MTQAHKIADGKVVSLSYSLTNSKGEILDRADSKEPFVYLHGASQIIPGLEQALEGLEQGAQKKVTVEPASGYGELDASLQRTVKKNQFPDPDKLEIGMQFQVRLQDGEGMVFRVLGLDGDEVTVDANHPLAGETLHFDVEVIEVRDATDDEKSHGHAHGPDGHHH